MCRDSGSNAKGFIMMRWVVMDDCGRFVVGYNDWSGVYLTSNEFQEASFFNRNVAINLAKAIKGKAIKDYALASKRIEDYTTSVNS